MIWTPSLDSGGLIEKSLYWSFDEKSSMRMNESRKRKWKSIEASIISSSLRKAILLCETFVLGDTTGSRSNACVLVQVHPPHISLPLSVYYDMARVLNFSSREPLNKLLFLRRILSDAVKNLLWIMRNERLARDSNCVRSEERKQIEGFERIQIKNYEDLFKRIVNRWSPERKRNVARILLLAERRMLELDKI